MRETGRKRFRGWVAWNRSGIGRPSPEHPAGPGLTETGSLLGCSDPSLVPLSHLLDVPPLNLSANSGLTDSLFQIIA